MFQILKDIKVKKIIVLAILIRLLLMPFFFHPDIKTYNYQASFLQKGVWDIYTYLSDRKAELPLKEEFVYFPLTYYFIGGYQFVISPLLGSGFNEWLSDSSSQYYSHPQVFKYLFLLKLPYLFLDILIGLLLTQFFLNEQKKREILKIWFFNPFSLILIYIFSNVDIMPVFLSVLSLLAVKYQRFALSALCLSLGAAFKAYTLLFIPLLIIFANSIRSKLLAAGIGVGVVAGVLVPFMGSNSFKESTLTSGLTTRLLLLNLDLGFGEVLLIGIVVISALVFNSLFIIKNYEKLTYLYAGLLLLLYSFIHFHIQWLLWVLPFLAIIVVTRKQFLVPTILLLTTAFIIPIFYDDKFMSVALLSVISPLYTQLPSPAIFIQRFYPPSLVQSLLHSILAGGSLIFCWRLLQNEK